jgi:type I site-specific restriction endonuclease
VVNENGDLDVQNSQCIMRITGHNEEGKAELNNFVNHRDPDELMQALEGK